VRVNLHAVTRFLNVHGERHFFHLDVTVWASSWERTSSFAWFCSVASCIGLSDPNWGVLLISKLKLQHEFTETSANRCFKSFVEHSISHHADTSEKVALRSSDPPGVSILSNLFTAKLTQKDTRLTKTEFTTAARQYVLLPPFKNDHGDILESKCGCQIQTCANASCKNKEIKLDAAGSHGLVCHPGVRALRATLLEKALEKCYRKAGGNPTKQPSTYSLLGGHFTKEDLSSLFCGRLNQVEAQERKKLAMTFLDIISKFPRGHLRTAELGVLRESFPPPSVVGEEDNNGIIRFDMRFSA
jgi:hypothetical protein